MQPLEIVVVVAAAMFIQYWLVRLAVKDGIVAAEKYRATDDR